MSYYYSLLRSAIENRSVTVEDCNTKRHYVLTQCSTSVLTSNCSTDDLAWVQCTLGGECMHETLGDCYNYGSLMHTQAHEAMFLEQEWHI